MKVLFCTSEVVPFASSGGLGDVSGSLPKAITKAGVKCRVVMPLYGNIPQVYRDKLDYVLNFEVILGWRKQYCGLFKGVFDGVTYYFLDNEYYFKRPHGLYGYGDDIERFAFYSKAIIELLFVLDYKPDVLHINDWQTALVPVLLKNQYSESPQVNKIKTLFTVHNIQYQGKMNMYELGNTLGMGEWEKSTLEFDGCINMMKGAIVASDAFSTVSPTYAQELKHCWFSHGLDGVIRNNEYRLSGILNGIDIESYNPKTDENIAKNYNVRNLFKGKEECKKELVEMFKLDDENRPIIAMITRLVTHKGLDLVQHMAEDIINAGFSFVLLGSGDPAYEAFFNHIAAKFPGKTGIYLGFVPSLARKIYAGADMFLMPSKSEPCGLSQMISCAYGTVPLVRETGGLNDSIQDNGGGEGNGYTFAHYNAHDMLDCCTRALQCYNTTAEWRKLMKRCLASDFSWDRSAEQYVKLYKSL